VFQDLDHGNVTYDAVLWAERRQNLLRWKTDFVRYERMHRHIRAFLQNPSDYGCFDHKESHLFWAELVDDDDNDAQHPLPCGNDLATPSLQRLAVLQLNHAQTYLASIMHYDTVLSREHQLEYHNLRKELRSFLDEYSLLGFVLFPQKQLNREQAEALDTLVQARAVLGNLNDHWEKFNLYRERHTHLAEQDVLQEQIAVLWNDFKVWAETNDLAGAIQTLIEDMSATENRGGRTSASSAP